MGRRRANASEAVLTPAIVARPPHPSSPGFQRGPEMTIYYQSGAILITHEVYVIAQPEPTRYPLIELDDVVIVRGGLPSLRVVSGYAAVAGIAVVITTLPKQHSALVIATAAVLLVLSALLGRACWRLSPRVYELRAAYRGQRILLYSSSDMRAFGQVQRGLLRALEARDRRSADLS
jgi:hypothetical protein